MGRPHHWGPFWASFVYRELIALELVGYTAMRLGSMKDGKVSPFEPVLGKGLLRRFLRGGVICRSFEYLPPSLGGGIEMKGGKTIKNGSWYDCRHRLRSGFASGKMRAVVFEMMRVARMDRLGKKGT